MPAMVQRKQTTPEVARAAAWLNSYPKASMWMSKYDLHAMLDQGGGLVRIESFMPDFVAEAVLQVLQAIPDAKWNATAAGEDYTQNNIPHQFYSTKHASALIDAVVRVITLLLPEQFHAFSAARYDRSHHIAPHDDRAYTPVQLDTGEVITCSREIGVIWYLTKDWKEEYGGALVDLESPGGPTPYVPLFNSMVAFRVPRYHEVTPVTAPRPRYSMFGWFLQPGKRYELYQGEARQAQQAQQGREAQQGQQGMLEQEDGQGGAGGEEESAAGRGKKKQKGREGQEGRQKNGSHRQQQQHSPPPPLGRLSLGVGGSSGGKRARGGGGVAQSGQQGGQAGEGNGQGEGVPACKLARRIAANAARRAASSGSEAAAGSDGEP